MIKDDDFRKAFGHVPPDANLDVFFDSCHAGSMTKEIPGINGISGEESVTYRYIEPPPDWGYLIESNPTIPVQGIFKHGTATRKADKEAVESEQLNHVLWAACRDYQTSAETQIGGVWRGVFTYCYCRALRRAGLGIIRRRLDELVSVDIKGLGYNQVPQLEGSPKSLDQKVFT